MLKPGQATHPSRDDAFAAESALGQLLRQANREYAAELDEPAAFRRLNERMQQRRRRSSWLRPAPALGFALMLLVVLPLGLRALRLHDGQNGGNAVPPAVRGASVLSRVPHPPGSEKPTEFPEIRDLQGPITHRTPDGTRLALDRGGVATLRRQKLATRVTLERGSLELQVARQPAGQRFDVVAGVYRFEVLGTVFKVQAGNGDATLEVREGSVAVYRDAELLRRVSAGEHWESRPSVKPPESAAGLAPSVATGRSSAGESCLSRARAGRARSAESCFQEQATGAGVGAEMALYELARLRRDVLKDSTGALAALQEHRRRFPAGALRREVETDLLGLLARAGRNQEALALSAELLSVASGRERTAELHLLRGNIYARGLANWTAAEREFALAERLGGTLGAEATYSRGECQEAMGDRSAAAESYRRYLGLSATSHRDAARRRLEKLVP